MTTTPPARKEDVKDPIGITGWPKEKGRDGERTPMQWNASAEAGFTTGKPWLPVPPVAAANQCGGRKRQPRFTPDWYRELIRLKKTNAAFERGDDLMLDTANDKVLSWMRQIPGEPAAVVVSVNFTAMPQTVNLSVPGSSGKLKTLLKTPGAAGPESLELLQLGPYGVYIGEVE